MGTVATDLDWAQGKLNDSGDVWPRSELLGWWNDGHRELLSRSRAVRRLRPLDLPGRHTYAVTQDWEDRHASGGTIRKPSRSAASEWYQATALWEIESLGGVTPSAALSGYTHEWERAHISGAVDQHFRFSFPKNHERVVRLEWQSRLLVPVGVRELDESDTIWMAQIGEPRWWTTGVGRIKTVELYEVTSTYQQAYDLCECEVGIPRGFNISIPAQDIRELIDVVTPATDSTYYGLGLFFGASTATTTRTVRQTSTTPWVSDSEREYVVTAAPDHPQNAFGYTTHGDADVLSGEGGLFAPATAYTQAWELATELLQLPAYNFVINLAVGRPYVVVHPWEIGMASDAASPGKRGMFAWENRDPHGNFASLTPVSNAGPRVSGLGLRCTVESLTDAEWFGTQPWEADHIDDAESLRPGLARGTYVWEERWASAVILGLGGVRGITSPDRQYFPVYQDAQPVSLSGRVVDFRSSDESLMAVEIITPDRALKEEDAPSLIPPQMQKYLRYYVLARAFGRAGEGRQPVLADHFTNRFLRGVAFFKKFTDLAMQDRVFVRDTADAADRYTPPRVRLPYNYPAVTW